MAVYGILVMVETDEQATEPLAEKAVVDEIHSNLESTEWVKTGDIRWFEVHALTPKLSGRMTQRRTTDG